MNLLASAGGENTLNIGHAAGKSNGPPPCSRSHRIAMTVRSILIHPDRRLRRAAQEADPLDPAVARLVTDLTDTMYDADGLGLAATQMGENLRVAVVDCTRDEDSRAPIVLINPRVVGHAEETSARPEGCLSIPEIYEEVARPIWVDVSYCGIDGVKKTQRFEQMESVCVQHEIDHLNGKLFIDYLGPVRRRIITNQMRRRKRNAGKEA